MEAEAGSQNDPPSTKILNTAIPPGASKYPTYSSNENNVESNSHQPSEEPLKQYDQKVEASGAKNSLSEEGSDERRDAVQNPHRDASRKRYQSNCSNISTVSECGVPMIPYEELEEATLFWSRSQLLGSGGFGTVYKGSWKRITVAVKRISASKNNGDNADYSHINQILEELRYLQIYRLDSILQVYGFSADPGKPHCLVYQFMSNGSLEYRLQCRKIEVFSESAPLPLNWRQRFVIALKTAAALQFLHTLQAKPLIHGDVKSANILLDDYLEPKLGDFGLAREGPQSDFTSMKVSHVHGTRPYIPDEYLRNKKLSTKVDTYSFGIVMFEICSGRKACNEKTKKYLKEEVLEAANRYVLMDGKAGFEWVEVFDVLFNVGMECINSIPKKRPDMTTVFENLDRVRKILNQQYKNKRYQPEDSQQQQGYFSIPSPLPYAAYMPTPQYPRSSVPPVSSVSPLPYSYVNSPPYLPTTQYPRPSVPPVPSPSPLPYSYVNSPPYLPTAQYHRPSVPPLPSPSLPPSHQTPTPPPSRDNGRSPPLAPLIPNISQLLRDAAEPQKHSESVSELISDSFSTEDESSRELNSFRDSEPQPYVEGEPGPSQETHANTVTNMCIPLLSKLGVADDSPKDDDAVVSAQGKKSVFD